MVGVATENRRRFSRTELRIPVAYATGAQADATLSVDLGGGGMRITLDAFVPVKTRLRLAFALESGREDVTLLAEIVWIQQLRYSDRFVAGLQFVGLPDLYRRDLSAELDRLVLRKHATRRVRVGAVSPREDWLRQAATVAATA